jgi:hypothetical protein
LTKDCDKLCCKRDRNVPLEDAPERGEFGPEPIDPFYGKKEIKNANTIIFGIVSFSNPLQFGQ